MTEEPQKSTLEAALELGGYGFRVVLLHGQAVGKCTCQEHRDRQAKGPCPTPGKHPRFLDWAKTATTDDAKIRGWWKAYPEGNVGLVSGEDSGFFVLDTDPRNNGIESREALILKHGRLPYTMTAKTGGADNFGRRGSHEYFRWPVGLPKTKTVIELDEGLEVLLDPHIVVAAPSVHPSGRRYEWESELGPDEQVPVDAPEWLLDLIRGRLQEMPSEATRRGGWPLADIGKILQRCAWMRHCSDDARSLAEPEWYSQLSILGACENGEQLAQELSSPHPGYNVAATAAKLRHAVEDAGPVTCAKVRYSLGGARFCESCKETVKSPIVLGRSDDATQKRRAAATPETPVVPAAAGDVTKDIGSDETAELPRIYVNNRQLPDISGEALSALQVANEPSPFLFVRTGAMVAVVRDEKQRHVISDLTESALRGWLARSAEFFKRGSAGGSSGVPPPLDVVRDILALAPSCWKFQSLDAVVESPVLRADGSILDQPGYDPATQLYYAPDPDLRVPPIAEEPMRDHLDAALDLVDQLIGEFPFADDASKANAIAALLTPIVRPAINAPAPMAICDAPQAGTGKSLLADVISIIATGRSGEMFSLPRDDDEVRKQLTTALLSGTAVIVIDNINRRLDNSDLCKVLTETQHADRAFRTHQKIVLPVKSTFLATGNNVQLGGDMPRRCYWIRMDARTSKPFMRTGFKIEDLKKWATIHRGELLAALLTLARAWYLIGRRKPKLTPLGSYEVWSTTVGGILEYAGVEGFLANAGAMYEEADSEAMAWEGFLLILDEVFYSEPFTVAQITEKLAAKSWDGNGVEPTGHAQMLRASMPDFLVEGVDRPGFFQKRTGRSFAERVGRRYGSSQVHLKRCGMVRGSQQWSVVLTNGLAK